MKTAKPSIMGTDALFENFTIEEIQEIEKKTKMEIEKKKEELRQMVGERYRDLMEAADTIQAMETSACNISTSIKNMVSVCENLPSQKKPAPSKEYAIKNAQHYEIGAQLKLLLDIPKEMWSYIDNKDYLSATKLYMLARHIHSSLQLSLPKGISMQKNFPIANRQWASISHFRSTILEGCHNMLEEDIVVEQKMADNLVALMLLEGTTPRQVFNQFLLSRTKSLQDIFSSDECGVSAKDQICNILRLVLDTVYLVHAIFSCDDSGASEASLNLLNDTLNETINSKSNGPVKLMNLNSPVMKYLPKIITDFHPVCVAASLNITKKEIETNCHDWIETITSSITKGFTKILSYVNSIRSLSSIRNSIDDLLNEDRYKSWDKVCNSVLNRSLNARKEFIQPIFLSKIKSIMISHLNGAVNFTTQALERALTEMAYNDFDLSSFVWSTNHSDGIDGKNWLNSSSKPLNECGQLAMKANGLLPIIQKLCNGLNGRLKAFLDDFKHYVTLKDSVADKDIISLQHTNEMTNVLSEEENTILFTYLVDLTVDSISSLFSFVDERLSHRSDHLAENMFRFSLLGKFLVGLAELCPQLQSCLHYSSTQGSNSVLPINRTTKEDKKTKNKWIEMKSVMKSKSSKAYSLWSESLVTNLSKKFEETAEFENDLSFIHQPLWNNIEINEESEDGLDIKSTIKVPSQISRHLLEILLDLSTILSQVGGHVMDKKILADIVYSLCNLILDRYQKLASSSLKQTRAVQLLFDVKFLTMAFIPKEDKKSLIIIEKIENQIDPFDLDVFNPHIQANLKRCIQGSMVLLGLIMPSEKQILFSSSRVSSSHDQHNVLPISNTQSSFSLLPISDDSSSKDIMTRSLNRLTSKKLSKNEKVRSVSPSPTRQRNNEGSSGMGQKSQSFYDRMTAMSSSWFGGQ